MDLGIVVSELKEKIDILQGERNSIVSQKQKIEKTINLIISDMDIYSQVRKLLEVLVKSTEINLRSYIEPLVTEALDFVFEQGLNFHLFFVSRRNQLEIDFIVLRNSISESNYQIWVQDPEKYENDLSD